MHEQYVVDLNESTRTEFLLRVDSSYNGKKDNWHIDNISCKQGIKATIYKANNIKIKVNLKEVKKTEYIAIRNTRNECYKIYFSPNAEAIRPREYVFYVKKYTKNDNTATIYIESSENGQYMPWYILTDGSPMKYKFKAYKKKLSIMLQTYLLSPYDNQIEIIQNESNKIIRLHLSQDKNEITTLSVD